ncbi:MAG: hypothetical protein WC802_03245 [Patescibacteria group bacterium]|jgi:PHD/YefM family antitoxin component YafN of YafNO toxin-antitoxin module
MQNSQFDRLLKLAKRTGDRIIVTGNDGEEPVVLLPLAEYESLLDIRTFRKEEETVGNEARINGYVEKFDAGVEPSLDLEDGEADFDPIALERQVMAAMAPEEPEVVPYESERSVQAPAFSPEPQESLREEASEANLPRKPIARKGPVGGDGEERFYLEAV